jgi:hypothetical protein
VEVEAELEIQILGCLAVQEVAGLVVLQVQEAPATPLQ